ncbi:pentatricopeptide repeat-containing protein [Quercus suber]|uniref:Pentatricopeptide repeat-containing protein n=1 Tax=Quercus suber TaxID=58331 RepID=A0AAW0LBM1_QUESU
MYAKCAADGSVDDAREVFDLMVDRNVMSWTAIIIGYVRSRGHDKEAVELFCAMIKGHVSPNLKACANLSDPCMGEQVYTHAMKLGLALVNCVGNSLISMYARSGMMEDAHKAFDMLFEKNLISYNMIVDANANNLNSEKAFELFREIEDIGIGASAFTIASLLSGAASISAVGKGEQIHAWLLKLGFAPNQSICSALISMYSRCGYIEATFQVFNDMGGRNVISWTSMITGFAKHGFTSKELEMFHKMLGDGVRPNEITYIAVLSAFSHLGLISKGWKLFNSMYREHGIVSRMEHYACMVDLLDQSRSPSEALKFINSMHFRADALVHGNKELGELAAKMILEQNPYDLAAYILLSNLYASLDFVRHDVENELKEQYLFQHSEKNSCGIWSSKHIETKTC